MRLRILWLILLVALSVSYSHDSHAQTPAIPERMFAVDTAGYDVVNILLAGMSNNGGNGLTDALLILSINRTTQTAAIAAIPRDLYVYAPAYGMMKINQTYYYATRDGHDGMELLKEVMRYNLGISIQHWVLIDFDGFSQLIDALGGVDVVVDCSLQDWKLKAPNLDRQVEDNWALFTLNVGVHRLNGETALWYARSRRTSSDLDRGVRQQDLLRAIWRRLRDLDISTDLPRLWELAAPIVQTDISLDQALALLPSALNAERVGLDYYSFELGREIEKGYTEDEGRFIFTPLRAGIYRTMQALVTPPTASQFTTLRPRVAVYNESGMQGLARVAADRLERAGFSAVALDGTSRNRQFNKVIDYTGLEKGNPISLIQEVLRISAEGVESTPQPQRDYDYEVFIGRQYSTFSCTRAVLPPVPTEPETGASG